MTAWRFLAFKQLSQRCPLDAWQDGLGVESFNRFSEIMERLQVLPRELWRRPDFDLLKGERYRGIGEIRFKGDKKVHRAFGWFGPERLMFTLLHACVKQRSDLTAEHEIARKHRDLIIRYGRQVIYDFTLKRSSS
jgi:hypothetical protein